MMKKFLYAAFMVVTYATGYSQVGINTPTPASTLDIAAKNSTGVSKNVDGLLMPRVDRQRAQSMTSIPTSALIYVNSVATGTQSGIAANIDAVGYYYYDGTAWIKLNRGSGSQSMANIYNSDGTLTGNRTVTQADKTLTFTGTTTNAFSVDGNTFSADAANHRIGIGAASPQNLLDLGAGAGNIADAASKKLSVYNDGTGNDFYGLGVSSNTLQFHAASTSTEAPGMVLNANGNVGIGASSPVSSAVLDLTSGNKGFLPPRLTMAQRDAISPKTAGLMIYNTSNNCLEFWNSSTWISKCGGSSFQLNCAGATTSGFLAAGSSATGLTLSVPYTGGNGSAYGAQTVNSTGVTGLTITLPAGNFANGNGSLVYTFSGTPSAAGTAYFAINIGGQSCTVVVTINPQAKCTKVYVHNNNMYATGQPFSGQYSNTYANCSGGPVSWPEKIIYIGNGVYVQQYAGTSYSGPTWTLTYRVYGTATSPGTVSYHLTYFGLDDYERWTFP